MIYFVIWKILILAAIGFVTCASFILVNFLKRRKLDSDRLSLAITLLGTALGVLLALWAGDIYQFFQRTRQLRNLYDAAEREIAAKQEEVGLAIHMTSIKGTLIVSIEPPKIIDHIASDPDFQGLFSPTMREHVFESLGSPPLRHILGFIQMFNDPNNFTLDDPNHMAMYHQQLCILYSKLDFQRRFISVEKQYLSGDLLGSRVRVLWDELRKESEEMWQKMKDEHWTADWFYDEHDNRYIRVTSDKKP